MAKEKKDVDAAREETIEKLRNLQSQMGDAEPEAEGETEAQESEGEDAGASAAEDQAAESTEAECDGADAATDGGGEEPAEAAGEGSADEKKGFFGKDKKKDKLQEQIEELNDRVKRQMAEFENFRKRTDKEKEAMFETGARSVLEKLLPVVDNFERGLDGLTEEEGATPFAEGMQKIYRQLIDELTKLDVKPIEAVGQEFDPNRHNAVMHVDDETVGDNIVVEELQKGYTYRDTVVRHSMVKVAN